MHKLIWVYGEVHFIFFFLFSFSISTSREAYTQTGPLSFAIPGQIQMGWWTKLRHWSRILAEVKFWTMSFILNWLVLEGMSLEFGRRQRRASWRLTVMVLTSLRWRRVFRAFASRLGHGSIVDAELWAILYGLYMALEMGAVNLIVKIVLMLWSW